MADCSSSNVFVCTICKSFASKSYRSGLNHIGNIHRFGPSKQIRCDIDGCPPSYTTENFNSFRSHVYRKHRDVLFLNETGSACHESERNSESSSDLQWHGDTGTHHNAPPNNDQELSGPVMKKAAALFLLKTLEERKITQVALDGIISDCQALMDIIFGHIQSSLTTNGVELELSQVVDKQVRNPFDGLEMEFRRAKYYRDEFGLIVSYAHCYIYVNNKY